MPYVYLLQHEHELPSGADAKLIGVYSTRAKAAAALRRVKSQPGFRQTPHGFTIDRYVIDKDHWTEGFVTMVGGRTLGAKRRKSARQHR